MVPHFHWNVARLLAIVFDRIDRAQWSLRVRQRSDPALQRAGIARAADYQRQRQAAAARRCIRQGELTRMIRCEPRLGCGRAQ